MKVSISGKSIDRFAGTGWLREAGILHTCLTRCNRPHKQSPTASSSDQKVCPLHVKQLKQLKQLKQKNW